MERKWKHYFYETPTKDEVWEIIRTLNNSLSPTEAISVQNLSSMETKKL